MEARIPTTNTWQHQRFAEHGEWLRRKVEEAARDRARMRGFPRDPDWQRLQEREMQRPAGSRPLTYDLVNSLHGLQRQQAHATDLLAATGAAPNEGTHVDDLIDQPQHPKAPALPTHSTVTVATSNEVVHLTPAGLLTTEDAAKYLGRKERALRRWRARKTGPKYIKTEGRYYYRLQDLHDYLEDRRHDPLEA